MKAVRLAIPDVVLLEPQVFGDERGFFFESFNQAKFEAAVGGGPVQFVQDNHSRSAHGVLRGLHYQIQQPQGKLVMVLEGEVQDVAVDIRRGSPTFGQSVSVLLSAENRRLFWIPEGFAHGFVVLSEHAVFHYLCTAPYKREDDAGIRWNDERLAIDWQVSEPLLSDKDAGLPFLDDIAAQRLPEMKA